MRWADITFQPSRRVLRQFAAAWLVCFAVLAWRSYFIHAHTVPALVFAVLAVAVGPLGLVWPAAVRWVYVAAMIVAFPIGWLVSRVLLAIVYYLVVTPIGLALRLAGRDPMHRRFTPDAATYWLEKPAATDPRRYFRQF